MTHCWGWQTSRRLCILHRTEMIMHSRIQTCKRHALSAYWSGLDILNAWLTSCKIKNASPQGLQSWFNMVQHAADMIWKPRRHVWTRFYRLNKTLLEVSSFYGENNLHLLSSNTSQPKLEIYTVSLWWYIISRKAQIEFKVPCCQLRSFLCSFRYISASEKAWTFQESSIINHVNHHVFSIFSQ